MKVLTQFLFVNIISLSFFIFIFPNPSFAATFYDTPPPTGDNYRVVADGLCGGPSECANSQSIGVTNCGTPCTGGTTWMKYELTCVEIVDEGRYDSYYRQGPAICSTADKCQSQPLLQSGRCDCSVGGTYKTCCTGDGNVNGSCVQSGTQDNTL